MNIPSHNARILEVQLRDILSGIEKNLEDWPENNKVSKKILLEVSDELNEKLNEINRSAKNLSKKRQDLQNVIEKFAKPLYKKARDQAYSIYGKNSTKLQEYNLKKIAEIKSNVK